jgi:DNA-binding response OmpR family regulator
LTDSKARQTASAGRMAPLILVVDDDPDICRLLRLELELEGYRVAEAASGYVGLRIARAEHPAAIILDAMLPPKGGVWVLQELKTDPATASIPVVYISARTNPEEVRQAMELGARYFMPKPFDPQELAGVIASLLPREDADA